MNGYTAGRGQRHTNETVAAGGRRKETDADGAPFRWEVVGVSGTRLPVGVDVVAGREMDANCQYSSLSPRGIAT